MANNQPENITAEWTVHAQLTITRPSDKVKNCKDPNDAQNSTGDPLKQSNPVTVVYKWSTDDMKNDSTSDKNAFSKANAIFKTERRSERRENDKSKHDSFHSTGAPPPSDSGFSTATTNSRKQSPFRSTCSIVLSACTDLFPATPEGGQEDPFTYNTTARYTVLPDQPHRSDEPSETFKNVSFLSVKDAFSQTSDNESKLKSENLPNKTHDYRKRRPYDYRRTTESMLSPPFEEAKQYSPSRHASRSPHRSPSHTISPTSSTRGNNHKKSPRTVHIDVYCTGSDAEDSSAEDESEASSYNHRIIEEESNSTPQTVYTSDQMKLHHRVAEKNELPRRLASQYNEKPSVPSSMQPRNHLLKKSSSKDEISESKQLLFNKHIGAQATKQSKFVMGSNRNRFLYRCDQSDDCLSSNYPSSSRSTVLDLTCSSISSGVLASTNSVNDYLESSSWKDTDCDISNRESERNDQSGNLSDIWAHTRKWRSPEKERRFLLQQKRMIEYMHQNERFIGDKRDFLKSQSVDKESEKENRVKASTPTPQTHVCCGQVVSESYPQSQIKTQGSVHKLVLGPAQSTDLQQTAEKHKRVLFTPSYSPSSQTSSAQSTILDSSNEHWARARKFGAIVGAMRKTGHHFGPAKNPDCQCEHCRRWMAERNQFRSRTLSVGDEPYNRSLFWLKRH